MYSNATALVLALVFAVAAIVSPDAQAIGSHSREFDYGKYATVLKSNVNDVGMVDYRLLKSRRQQLDAFALAAAELDGKTYQGWDAGERMAFWVNAYNALTLKAIIDNYPIKSSFFRSRIYPKNSIRQIPGVWDKIEFRVAGRNLTLEHIEHKILRVQFNEPRIHMAMVCAAIGCPPLRNEPYVGARLDEQLDDQTRRFLRNPAKFRIDRRENRLYLSPVFKWFAGDFVSRHGRAKKVGKHSEDNSAVLNFISGYLSDADKKYILSGKFRIKYLDYDWSLNEQSATR